MDVTMRRSFSFVIELTDENEVRDLHAVLVNDGNHELGDLVDEIEQYFPDLKPQPKPKVLPPKRDIPPTIPVEVLGEKA